MTKQKALEMLINKIYDYTGKLIISKKDIKKIEKYYIDHSECKDIEEFEDKKIKEIVHKLKSGKDEINKQLKNKKALQPGILAECVFMQTVAKIIGLRNYIDLETTSFADVPIELAPYIKSKSDTICAARYIYYNKKDYNTLIIQYGNPKAGDAVIIIDGQEIIVEIKDMPALLMDTDLLYDEQGKIIITKELKLKYPDYIKYIDDFNKRTSIIKNIGKNYKLFTDDSNNLDRLNLLKMYFKNSNIDIILTSIGKNELIAINTKDIDYVFPDNVPLIYTSGSEIRTTGKNSRATVFTPIYLNKILKEKDIEIRDNNICRIYHSNQKIIGKICGRGKGKTYTRLKINNAFFVRMENLKEYDTYDEFSKDKICQSKSGIALHIEIKKNKKEIKEYLYNIES